MNPHKNPPQNLTNSPFTGDDAQEYLTIRTRLGEVLKKFGGYEPAIDDIYLDQIARNIIFQRKADLLLTSETVTEYTFARLADAKIKFARIVDNAINELAISRRSRLINETESGLLAELREAMMRGLNAAT